MTTYDLEAESGPKRRKTMVHVAALLGCIAQGPTTEDAIDAAPEAIQAFLAFVAARGEQVDPAAPFDVRVTGHVTEGMWLGNGDPSIVFVSDVPPVTPKELAAWISRWHAIRTATETLVAPLSEAAFTGEPAKGRGVVRIVGHILGASPAYLRTFGSMTELNRLARDAEKDPACARAKMIESTAVTLAFLEGLKPADRMAEHHRGSGLWTARKTFRRLLEHEWEHHRELVARLG